MNEFKFIKNVNNLDELKNVIKTNSFWRETWSLSTLERIMDLKFILLSENLCENNLNPINCGQLNYEDNTNFNPDYYLMLAYANHYELVTYNGSRSICIF